MINAQSNVAQLVREIRVVLEEHKVKRASLFGSYVRGDNKADSDIDILVELEKGKSLLDLIGLQQELEDKLKKKVDVITYNSINPHLKESILSNQLQII